MIWRGTRTDRNRADTLASRKRVLPLPRLRRPNDRWALLPLLPAGIWLILVAVSVPLQVVNVTRGTESLGPSLAAVFFTAAFLTYMVMGTLILVRWPAHPVGRLLCALGLAAAFVGLAREYTTYAVLTQPGALPAPGFVAWLWNMVTTPAPYFIGVFLPLLLPTGRLPRGRGRAVLWLATVGCGVVTLGAAIAPGPLRVAPRLANPLGIHGIDLRVLEPVSWAALALLPVCALAALTRLALRFRSARGEEREQVKWLASALGLAVLCLGAFVALVHLQQPQPVVQIPLSIAYAGIGFATGVAVLKYRLYAIDLVINRTLVYGGLTVSVVALYVLVVGGLGDVLQARGNPLLSLLATGLVAVLFAPGRDRLQRAVNRLMHGDRDEPYAALSRLGQRLEASLQPESVLPTIVETVAQALKLPYAAIVLNGEDGDVLGATYGKPADETVTLPLVYGAQSIGRLVLAPRAPGASFTTSDRRLLDELARQAGVAARAVALTSALQRSNEELRAARQRLVGAREEERRRLRRDLHDGLGPALASQSLKIGAMRKMLYRDPARVDDLLLELASDIEMTIADIRRLVYELRPPALDELGLVDAVRDHVAQCPAPVQDDRLEITVDAPPCLSTLPAAVEVAAYRVVQEAFTNVTRHARARRCSIRFAMDRQALVLEVTDDGVGLPTDRQAGVGLLSMRERVIELGGTFSAERRLDGGTRVAARLPLVEEA